MLRSPERPQCAGCHNKIKNNLLMKCCECLLTYDLKCAKVSRNRYDLMMNEHKQTWKCYICQSAAPKTSSNNNSRSSSPSTHQQDDDNITFRRSTGTKQGLSDISPGSGGLVSQEVLRDIIRDEIGIAFKTAIGKLVAEHLANINENINSFDKSLSFNNILLEEMKHKLDEKVQIIDKLEKENVELRSTVTDLTTRLNSIEQNMRECNVEINGIPENRSENLPSVMLQLGQSVECPITHEDIQHVTRVAKLNKDSDRPKAVVLKLRTRLVRDNLLAAVSKFNKGHVDDKLSTRHLGIGGKREPIFVSEHLSPHNKHLHAATRKKAREAEYKFVWVRDGRIYAKKNETSQAIYVRSLDSLALLK